MSDDDNSKEEEWKDKDLQYWREKLTPDQFAITRRSATEPAFSGEYYDYQGEGTFECVCCGQPLYSAETKFDSGSGWPSFYEALPGSMEYKEDRKLWMKRVEVKCSRCSAHLGHVFDDGPEPTGKRYCINSLALKLKK